MHIRLWYYNKNTTIFYHSGQLFMKKLIICFIIIVLLLLSCGTAFALDTVSFETVGVECRQNRLIEVNVNAECGKKLSAAIFEFNYDKTILEFRKASVPSEARVLSNETEDCVKVSYLCTKGADISRKAAIITLTFKSIRNGSTDVGFKVYDCVNSDVQSMSVGTCTAGAVTVTPKASADVGTADNEKSSTGQSSSDKSNSKKNSSSADKQTSSVQKSRQSTAKEQETKAEVNDFGNINDVIQRDYDRLTPLIVLSASVIVGGSFIGFLIFKVITYYKDKKKDSSD